MTESADDKIIAALRRNPEGILNTDLKTLLPGTAISDAVNKLLGNKVVEMVATGRPKEFLLRLTKGTTLSNSSPEEQLVFSLIEEAGTKGIWIKDIRDRSGLTESQMKRVLKSLEKGKMVKAIKAVGTTRKCYILYNLEADESVGGGIFYQNQEVDTSFVQTLINVSVAFLLRRQKQAFAENQTKLSSIEASFAHVSEVAQYIREKNLCTVAFSEEDVLAIMELAYKRNRVFKSAQEGFYRFRPLSSAADGSAFCICAFCPVRNDCKPGYKISPETCQYIDQAKLAVRGDAEDGMDDLEYDSDF